MRAPFQEGEFPGPVKYGYLSVGVVERGPRALRGRTVFCLHPHQTEYVVPASAVFACPTTSRRRGRCSPAPSRRRSTRCGTPARCPATASRWSARAWSAAAWRGCWRGSPACASSWSTSTRPGQRSPTRWASTSRVPAGRRRGTRPGGAHERHRRGPAALARPAGDRGLRRRAQLVRRRRGHPLPRRCLPLRAALDPGQPGRRGRAGPSRPPQHGRSAGPGARAAPRPGVRLPADGRVAVRGAALGAAAAGERRAAGAVPRRHLRGGARRCSA